MLYKAVDDFDNSEENKVQTFIKFGISEYDIDSRLSQYRTTIPFIKLKYVVFVKDAKEIENQIKRVYKDKLFRGNHELMVDEMVSLKTIIKFIEDYVLLLGIENNELDDDIIEEYNLHNNTQQNTTITSN